MKTTLHSAAQAFVLATFSFLFNVTQAQTPFVCDNTLYQSVKNPNGNYELYEIQTSPVQFNLQQVLGPIVGHGVNALAYNPEDNFIYAVSAEVLTGHRLYRIDADYNLTDLGAITGLPANIGTALGGAIDLDGNYYITLHKWAELPYETAGSLYRLDISTLNATFVMNFSDYITDFAVDPFTGKMYGVDVDGGLTAEPNQLKEIDPLAGTVTVIGNTPIDYGSVASMFFDSNGDLYGYAVDTRTAETGAEVLVRIDKTTGTFTALGYANSSAYSDGCSCAFGFKVTKRASLSTMQPGSVFDYIIEIFNATGKVATNVQYEEILPGGMTFVGNPHTVEGLTFVNPDQHGKTTTLLEIAEIPLGKSSFRLRVKIPINYEVPEEGEFLTGAGNLLGLPAGYPLVLESDDPSTLALNDSTVIEIEPLGDSALAIEYSSEAYCVGDTTTPTPEVTGDNNGTFSVYPAGLACDSTTGGLDVENAAVGTYEIVYTTNQSTYTEIRIDSTVSGGISSDTALTEGMVDLHDLLDGETLGGSWSDDDATGHLYGSQVDVSLLLMGGSYDFTYTVDGGGCPDESSTVAITKQDTTLAVQEHQNELIFFTTDNTVSIRPNTQLTFNLYNALGKCVKREEQVPAGTTHQIFAPTPGLYLLEVQFQDGTTRVHKLKL